MNQTQLLERGLKHIREFVASPEFKTKRFFEGDYIVKQDQQLDFVYWASVVQYSIFHTAQNGKSLSLGDYYSEDRFFGEVELFSDEGFQFDVVATADVDLTVIPYSAFVEFLANDGAVAFWMNSKMATVYQQSMQVAIERSLYPLRFNILKDIMCQAEEAAPSVNHAYMYQEAQRFGCSERAYNRVVRELIDEELISKRDSDNRLLPKNIPAIAQCLERYQG